jgi:GntR family transcriptional regulator, vanillate catabolism transcriptional regulator
MTIHKHPAALSISEASGSGPQRPGDVASQTARAFIGVRDLLLRGDFGRGERISELPLVARLGMSRTPIRLALERLAHMGLLDFGPTGGFSVREFTITDVRDSIELRGTLEGTAARLAAERLVDDGELVLLRRWRDEMDALSALSIHSFAHYMDLNESFHSTIVELAKSPMLARLLDQANSLPFASPSAMVFPTSMMAASDETLAIAQEHHRALVEAIQNREGARAEHLGREHARLARRVFELSLSDSDVLSRVPGGALINVSVR